MSKNSEATNMAMSALLTSHPFFASLIYSTMKLKEVTTPEHGTTAATDGQTIWVYLPWWEKLTVPEMVFVLAHEVCHGMWLHMGRGKVYKDRGTGPNGKKWIHKTYNIAADYVINATLCESSVGTMPTMGLKDKRFTSKSQADQVYIDIYEEEEEKGGDGAQSNGDGEGHGGFDQHVDPEEAPTAADEANMETAIKQAAQTAKAQGKLPDTMKDMIDDLLNPVVPWQDHLRRDMTMAFGKDDISWNKPNRRRLVPLVGPAIIMPSSVGSTCGTIVTILDISGSISNHEHVVMLTEIKAICDEHRPERLLILWTNSGVVHVDDLEEPEMIDDVIQACKDGNRPSGGGTDMTDGFRYVHEWGIEPTTCVVFTDGYTPFGSSQPFSVIWAMTTDIEAPWGSTIKVEIDA